MKIKVVSLVFFFLIVNFTFGQVKFRVKKLNADSLVELIPEKEGTEKIDVLNILSNVICRKDLDSSINLATRAIELSKKLEYQKGLADGYFNVGNGYFLLDSLQHTISNYLKALRIYEDLVHAEEYGNLCIQLSIINYHTGRMEAFRGYNKLALNIFDRIEDGVGKVNANMAMGVGKLVVSHELDSAIYYFNKALSFLDPALEQTEVAYLYRNIGMACRLKFQELNDTSYLSKSLYWHFEALALPNIADEAKAFVYYEMGNTYFAINSDSSISSGIECYQNIIRIADNCFDAIDLKNPAYEKLGWIYYMQGNYDSSIFYFQQGINIIDERESDFSFNDYKEPNLAINWKSYHKLFKPSIFEGMHQIYSDLGKYKKALEFYKLSKKAEKEIYLEKNQKLITMLESVSEDEKTEKQMAVLAKDNELNKMKVKQSRTYLIAMGGIVLIIVLIAMLFIRQRKTRLMVREQNLLHVLELKNLESEKLKELDHLKSRFFANISHEFRTPLTLIMGPLEKLLSKDEDINEKKELGIAKKYAGKLQILINNLLSISKLESGKMKLLASETDIVKLVGTYIQSFESLAKQKNIELNFKASEENIKAYIDREKSEQILNNLLSNAFKFTEEGGRIEIAVSCWPLAISKNENQNQKLKANSQQLIAAVKNQTVQITVTDTGQGITPEHINHIFDRFYQAGQENNSYYEGTGIGLALTKELVELHRGTIKVESEHRKGSIFTILLPLGKEHLKPEEIVVVKSDEKISTAFSTVLPDDQKENLTVKDIETESDNNQPILLIVEDNNDMRSYIRGYFENEFHIFEAVDGTDGYLQSTRHIPDIIISDVMMPKMDGIEFCKKVKTDECTSHIPVILLTARASKESRMEGLEKGADDFITKPFDGEELQVRVKNLIDQRKKLSAVLERKFQKIHAAIDLDFTDIGITSMDDKFLQKAKEVVNKNLSNPEYTMADFTSDMAFSRVQLHRKLKALIGISSTEFIRTIRLNFAIELLQKKAGTISEIAYDSGFNNPTYFSKVFRQKFGMSPSEYLSDVGNEGSYNKMG